MDYALAVRGGNQPGIAFCAKDEKFIIEWGPNGGTKFYKWVSGEAILEYESNSQAVWPIWFQRTEHIHEFTDDMSLKAVQGNLEEWMKAASQAIDLAILNTRNRS